MHNEDQQQQVRTGLTRAKLNRWNRTKRPTVDETPVVRWYKSERRHESKGVPPREHSTSVAHSKGTSAKPSDGNGSAFEHNII